MSTSDAQRKTSERITLSVVMPVYNEVKTLEEIVRRVQAVPIDKELVIVDDGSKDGSRDILKRLEGPRVQVIFHEKNTGKAGALATGFKAARGDIVIIQDADLEYDPAEFPQILSPILDGKADVVFGSRFQGRHQRVHLFWHYIANRLLTLMSNLCTNLNLTDMECCYKAMRREIVENLTIQSRRFAVEPELAQKIAKFNVRVYEVGCSYYGRDYSEGKKIGLKDAFEAVWAIARFKFFWYPKQRPKLAPYQAR